MKLSNTQHGFSLLEVLITLVIISIGLLGIAAMQALSINNTGVARTQTIAAVQADSLASLMQANSAYWRTASGIVNVTSGTAFIDSSSVLSSTPPIPNCTAAACTPAQIATSDLLQWGGLLASRLPPGSTGSVNCVNVPVACTITIAWVEKNMALNQSTNASPGSQTYSLVVQP